MSKLPSMPFRDRIQKTTQVVFGGLCHHVSCSDGELYDMSDISCKAYPIMTVRSERGRRKTVSDNVRQVYADNGVMLSVTEEGLYYNDLLLIEQLANPEETYFVRFGNRVILMPDKKLLNLTYPIRGHTNEENLPTEAEVNDCIACLDLDGHYALKVWDGTQWVDNGWFDEPIEVNKELGTVIIGDGKLYNKTAKANSMIIPGMTIAHVTNVLRLKEGDAVTFSGMALQTANNKTPIIREIGQTKEGYAELRFSEYCFKMPVGEDGEPVESYEESNVRLRRSMPDMDFMFEHGNRLWGAKGKEIFASKLGDPRNWNSFDGLSTDSWYLATQSRGEITAGISYRYPVFFREESMLTVYGSIPSGFQTSETQLPGVAKGKHKSLASCNNLLFWLSRAGMVLYNGSGAYLQDKVFGDWTLHDVLSRGDEQDCYCFADLGEHPEAFGERLYALFRYDTQRNLWTKESTQGRIVCMTGDRGKIYALHEYGGKYLQIINGGDMETEEERKERVESYAEFGDFTDAQPNRKALNRLQLRLEVAEDAGLSVYIQYDSSGVWNLIRTIKSGKKRSVYLPIVPRRCDHYRIRLIGYGKWKLFSMARERCFGSGR